MGEMKERRYVALTKRASDDRRPMSVGQLLSGSTERVVRLTEKFKRMKLRLSHPTSKDEGNG